MRYLLLVLAVEGQMSNVDVTIDGEDLTLKMVREIEARAAASLGAHSAVLINVIPLTGTVQR